jgi:anthranilate phosphoribosyltransferase
MSATQSPANFARWIREIGRGPHGARPLSGADACELFSAMLAGDVPALELGAILVAYRIKGETLDELTGFMAAIEPQLAQLTTPIDGPAPVVLPCYNGARRLPNLTALVALLLKRYGVPVLLHGMTDEGGTFNRVTTAAILRELGVDPADSVGDAQRRLDADGIAYAPTAVLSPPLASLLDLRQRMGLRSVGHTLAKLIDPFGGAGFRVVAVTHPDYVSRMREFLAATHANALLMRGTEGEPFANPRRQPRIERFDSGVASVAFEAESVEPASLPAFPATIDAASTAVWISAALGGETAIPQSILNQLACCLQGAARQP